MKISVYICLIIALGFSFTAYAQTPLPPDSKPDKELECKEADARIEDFQKRIENLRARLADLTNSVATSEAELERVNQQLLDCEKEILSLIPATEADVEAFRQRLGVLEGKVRQMKTLPNDVLADRRSEVEALEQELNELRANRLSVIPEFFDKIITIAQDIRGLYREKKVSGYTVGT